jgi:hypothetical protein
LVVQQDRLQAVLGLILTAWTAPEDVLHSRQ